MEKVNFKSSGKKLVGTLFGISGKKKRPAILFISGWTASRDKYAQYAKAVSDNSFVCMTFDLSGHGESDGDIDEITREEFLRNCLDAYDYFSALKGVNPDNISVVGSSFGSYLASILASKRKVKNLALNVPQNYPDRGFVEPKIKYQGDNLKEWREKALDYTKTKSLRSLHSFVGYILIVQAGLDEYVPLQTTRNYVDSVKDEKKLAYIVLKGFPHSYKKLEHRSNYEKILVKWLRKYC